MRRPNWPKSRRVRITDSLRRRRKSINLQKWYRCQPLLVQIWASEELLEVQEGAVEAACRFCTSLKRHSPKLNNLTCQQVLAKRSRWHLLCLRITVGKVLKTQAARMIKAIISNSTLIITRGPLSNRCQHLRAWLSPTIDQLNKTKSLSPWLTLKNRNL